MTDDSSASTPTTPPADDGPRPFTLWLAEQQNGNLHSELSEQLQELVARVKEHDKAGTLTLKITVKPMGNGSNVLISDEVKLSAPEPTRAPTLFYATESGRLSRRDPRQPELPLNELRDRKAG